MEFVLHVVRKNSKKIAVCGDFNINILETCSNSNRFLSLFQSFNLHHTFCEPTRVCIAMTAAPPFLPFEVY
jgi:hypothetical protein